MRTLKFHEKKLLKKVDLLWKKDENLKEVAVLRRYHIQKRDDYIKYNKLCGIVTKLVSMLRKLDSADSVRVELTDTLLEKLFNMGVIPHKKSLVQIDKIAASAFCRRRLPIVMVRLKMAETVKQAVAYVEQGHVRVGPTVVNDPALLVTRSMEDFVTWNHNSNIKRKIMKYNDKLDDFELLGM